MMTLLTIITWFSLFTSTVRLVIEYRMGKNPYRLEGQGIDFQSIRIGKDRIGVTKGSLTGNIYCGRSNSRGFLHRTLGSSLLSMQNQILLMFRMHYATMEKKLQQLSL